MQKVLRGNIDQDEGGAGGSGSIVGDEVASNEDPLSNTMRGGYRTP